MAARSLDGATVIRLAAPTDAEALAALMLDAYRGTIDFEGETLEDARSAIASAFAGDPTFAPRAGESFVVESEGEVASACLVWDSTRHRGPLVAYVMTAAARKGRGLAAQALAASLDGLRRAGASIVCAVITEGNEPSERLFASFGFRRQDAGFS